MLKWVTDSEVPLSHLDGGQPLFVNKWARVLLKLRGVVYMPTELAKDFIAIVFEIRLLRVNKSGGEMGEEFCLLISLQLLTLVSQDVGKDRLLFGKRIRLHGTRHVNAPGLLLEVVGLRLTSHYVKRTLNVQV